MAHNSTHTTRTALVTGGGSGIGRAVAVALARAGLDVLIVGRRADKLAETAALGTGIRAHVGDVTNASDIGEVVETAVAEHGRLDVLVNNAGIGRVAPLGQIEAADARRIWEVNVLGPTLLTQAALPHLLAGHGSIVNISSTFGAKPAPRLSQYGASKAAIEQLTRSWALELGERGVRVNAVAPGPTESEGLAHMGLAPEQIQEIKARERERIPLRRRGEPAEVARWVVALAAEDGWVTGQVIGVDGGYLLA
jgi:NAD(P)-dependent dehydrogenase (short-subunit alcohol dehydrogenase family)